MREIRTEIEIDSPPGTVWALLTDIESYDEWNPHLTSASGELREGGSLEITVDRLGAKRQTMRVRVSEVDPPRRLRWIGTVVSKWVFRGRHTFELHELEDGRTRLVNLEELSGVLVPYVVTDEPQRDYERMNQALKDRLEH